MNIYVTPKGRIQDIERVVSVPSGSTAHLSIHDPGETPPNRAFGVKKEDHHILFFHDLNDNDVHLTEKRYGGYTLPSEDDVINILSFFEKYKHYPAIIINCYAGISRSTASAFIFHCLLLGSGKEIEAMRRVERSCLFSYPRPNERIVRFADRILNRNGAMIGAVRQFLHKPAQILLPE